MAKVRYSKPYDVNAYVNGEQIAKNLGEGLTGIVMVGFA
jgi:hypothetical protein